ncbi:MAG TPA: ABC transporter substrate-binding protein [Chloroflexota bacterium]|nr:ABC transporter substrate-binding protein [Chloroflexota bacterium]
MVGRESLLAGAACAFLLFAAASGCAGTPGAPPPAPPAAPPGESAASVTVAPASPHPAPALRKVQLAVPAKSFVFLPYYFGQHLGLYAEQGIDLDIAVVQPSTAIAATVAGEVQYNAASGSTLGAALAGAPLRNVMFVMVDLIFSLYAQPEVRTVAELAGGTVAVTNRYATDDYALAAILRHYGVPDDRVTRVTAGTAANSFTALTSRGVTGAILSPPYSELAERQGFTFLEYAANMLKRSQSGLATTVQRIEQQPDEVKRMIRATLASIRAVQDRRDEATAFAMQLFELDTELAAAGVQKAAQALARDGKMPADVLDAEAADIAAAQHLSGPVRGSQFVDYRLLDEVLREPAVVR